MRICLIPILFALGISKLIAQPIFEDPDKFLQLEEQKPKVLLVGSFHFNYPGLDAHKISEDEKINIYSEKRQQELQELLGYLSKFKPTKIVVEAGANTGYLFKNYERYQKGSEKLYASETSQIGMRLVERFQLDTIYGVDSSSLLYDLYYKKDSLAPKTYIDKITERHYFGGNDDISKRYSNFYQYKDKLTVNQTLLETFSYMNSNKVLDRGFGAYISGGQFISKDMKGPDALSMFWLNRNLRIYRKIQQIKHTKSDQILVIFGAGHVSILKWLFQCSPEFNLINFNSL
jgi:hypothetical protein